MKRFVLAIALTGLMSMTVLAGHIPINGVVAGEIPTNGVAGHVPTNGAVGDVPTNGATSTSSTLLVTVILTVLGLR